MEHPRSVSFERPVDWLERLAIAGSLACMIHCLALPVAMALLPALTELLNIPESAHIWALVVTVPAAGVALSQGRHNHGSLLPLALGTSGIALLLIGLSLTDGIGETVATLVGSLLLTSGHLLNWRLRHACNR